MIKILFLGDIVSKTGRKIVKEVLPELKSQYEPSVTIANGENAAGGFGLDLSTCDEILSAGVELITTGNHIWKKKDIVKYLESKSQKLIRPANYPEGSPGNGFLIHVLPNGQTLGLANVMGRVFLSDLIDCPFRKIDEILSGPLSDCDYTFVDFHAEATSEKVAFGYHLDGRATIVVGTHTHVQTADERLLPEGTAYITDVGMCGPYDGVIGMDKDTIIKRFMSARSENFGSAKGRAQLNAVLITLDEATKKALKIERIFEIRD